MKLTGAFRQEGGYYTGWVEELPAIQTQAKSLPEARQDLLEKALYTLRAQNRSSNRKKRSGRKKRKREEFHALLDRNGVIPL